MAIVTASAVVTSTCFHACILKDSEVLRKEIPGLDRFKTAAQKNSNRWFDSNVKFLPAAGAGVVQIYDPETKSFIDHPESDPDDDIIVDVFGPFAYFLATVNADRLEPTFRIAPCSSDIPPTEATFDVIIVRPLRNPKITMDSSEARDAFVPALWAVMNAAYQNGDHVNLRYQEDGSISVGGDGPLVVEYIRCGGWEWTPVRFP